MEKSNEILESRKKKNRFAKKFSNSSRISSKRLVIPRVCAIGAPLYSFRRLSPTSTRDKKERQREKKEKKKERKRAQTG